MDALVRERGDLPIETLKLTYDQVVAFIKPLQDEVRSRGLWAAHLPGELGGMGFGQVKLGLMHEILGQTPYGPWSLATTHPTVGTRNSWRRAWR